MSNENTVTADSVPPTFFIFLTSSRLMSVFPGLIQYGAEFISDTSAIECVSSFIRARWNSHIDSRFFILSMIGGLFFEKSLANWTVCGQWNFNMASFCCLMLSSTKNSLNFPAHTPPNIDEDSRPHVSHLSSKHQQRCAHYHRSSMKLLDLSLASWHLPSQLWSI